MAESDILNDEAKKTNSIKNADGNENAEEPEPNFDDPEDFIDDIDDNGEFEWRKKLFSLTSNDSIYFVSIQI